MSSFLLNAMFKLKAPFSEEGLLNMRFQILKYMKEKKFNYFIDQMDTIRQEIEKLTNEQIIDDNYWLIRFPEPYWQRDFPYLDTLFKNQNVFYKSSEPNMTLMTTMFMNELHAENLLGGTSWMTVQQQMLFKTIIMTYFKKNRRLWPIHLNMDMTFIQSQKKILNNPVNRNTTQNNNILQTLCRSLLSGSGPFILKILQQINSSTNNKIAQNISVSEITRDIFDNVPGLTPAELDFVCSSLDIPQSYLTNMDPAILGSASIAEIHKTYSDEYQMPAVLKFIKPIYAFFFMCEVDYLLTDAWKMLSHYCNNNQTHLIQCRKLLMFFIKEFMREFDYYNEYVNTTMGYVIYNKPNQNLCSVTALQCSVNPFPVLILNYIEGSSIVSLLNTPKINILEIHKMVTNLLTVWFKETLWGSGFFHSDMHLGNLLLDFKNSKLYTIDFGSCGVLNQQEQCAMITAMIISSKFIQATSKLSVEKRKKQNIKIAIEFVRTIWSVCNVTTYTQKHLHDIAIKIINKQTDNKNGILFSSLFLDIIEYSDNIGTCNNSAVLLFGRACAYIGDIMSRIENQCGSNCPMWNLKNVISSQLIYHPMQLIKFYTTKTIC